MRPYVVQNLRSEFGETASARLISPRGAASRILALEGTEVTIRPETGTVYECGEVTTLTLSELPASGSFLVVFTSGQNATTLTVPQTLAMPEGFAVAANTRYELSVRDGYALCAGWAVNAE